MVKAALVSSNCTDIKGRTYPFDLETTTHEALIFPNNPGDIRGGIHINGFSVLRFIVSLIRFKADSFSVGFMIPLIYKSIKI